MKRGRQVIVVTDGDHFALRALQMAAKQIPARVISRSVGNPTRLSGFEIVRLVKQARFDPVLVMLDDNGDRGESSGEGAFKVLRSHPDIHVIGALAVASNTSQVKGVPVDFSIDCYGNKVNSGVNKDGRATRRMMVYGDTVDVLCGLGVPVVVGIGDIGKMKGRDAPERASPITTKAIRELLAAYRQWELAHGGAHSEEHLLAYGRREDSNRKR